MTVKTDNTPLQKTPLKALIHETSIHQKLLRVHPKAVEIMLDVRWGNISKKTMAKELSYAARGIVMKVEDIDLIINVSHFILETEAQKRVDKDAFLAIIREYPNLRLETADLDNLEQYEIDALTREKLDTVCLLYEKQITCEILDSECPVRVKEPERTLAEAVNSELKRLNLPLLDKSGDTPTGPFYALYRAVQFHRIPGTFDKIC